MHTAAREGNEYTMKGLVMVGADINIKDKDGVSVRDYNSGERFKLTMLFLEHPKKTPRCSFIHK